MTEKPDGQAQSPSQSAERPIHQGRQVRVGVVGTLIALQALFATGTGANTLSVTRAEEIREKMARQNPQEPESQKQVPVKLAQFWNNWSNWGNWPGWLPKKLQKWRWPRA